MNTETRQLSIFEIVTISADPSARKSRGNKNSAAAHEKVRHVKEDYYKRIMELLAARSDYGATSKEIAAAFGVALHKLSGRCSEMKSMGWIKENGERREGAAVLVIC